MIDRNHFETFCKQYHSAEDLHENAKRISDCNIISMLLDLAHCIGVDTQERERKGYAKLIMNPYGKHFIAWMSLQDIEELEKCMKGLFVVMRKNDLDFEVMNRYFEYWKQNYSDDE